MGSTKYLSSDLFIEIQDMKNRMDKIMENTFENFGDKNPSGTWEPLTDVYETEKYYIIQMEVPGLEKADINIEIKSGELTISGEKKLIKETSTISYLILERSYGPFLRRFNVPNHVDRDKISAHLDMGILTIKLPKKDIRTEQETSISIQVEE